MQVTPVVLAVADRALRPQTALLAGVQVQLAKVATAELALTLKATPSATAAVVVAQVALDKTLLLTSVALVLAALVPPTQSVQALRKPMQAVVAVVR
jgi:hypothetical protein